jgi:hypothetical protein
VGWPTLRFSNNCKSLTSERLPYMQTPTGSYRLMLSIPIAADNRLNRSRRNVVVPRRHWRAVHLSRMEGLCDLLFVRASIVASTHGLQSITAKIKSQSDARGQQTADPPASRRTMFRCAYKAGNHCAPRRLFPSTSWLHPHCPFLNK